MTGEKRTVSYSAKGRTKKALSSLMIQKHPLHPFNRFDGDQFGIRLVQVGTRLEPTVYLVRECPAYGGAAIRAMNARNGVGRRVR